MPSLDINFLRSEQIRLSEQAKQDKKIFKIVSIAAGCVFLVFLIVFGINQYLSFRLNQVSSSIQDVSQEVQNQESLEAEYLFFVDKLKIIRQLFNKRSNKQLAIDYFTDLFSQDVEIVGINYDMATSVLSLRIKNPHIFRLEDSFDILEDPAVQSEFTSFKKERLHRERDGSYSIGITVTLREDSELIEETF